MQPALQYTADDFMRRYWPEEASLPKHEKLRQAIMTSIFEGYWPPGGRLPTEAEWVAAMPCSLGTVQRALRELVADGLIERRRGSGTVVANLDRRIEEPWHMRFVDPKDAEQRHLLVKTKVLSRRVVTRDGPWSQDLNQEGRPVVRIERIMEIADEFGVYNLFYALADRYSGLVDQPISDLTSADLKLLMARQTHLPVHRIRQLMRFEPPPEWVKEKCRWPGDALASVLNVVAYSHDGAPMYYQEYFIPPTRYTLDLGTITRT